MNNVKFDIKGDVLTITVNLKERHGRSASGKSETIATTAGNSKLPAPFGDVSVGLNVYTRVQP
jgi:hypothetical protein